MLLAQSSRTGSQSATAVVTPEFSSFFVDLCVSGRVRGEQAGACGASLIL